MTEIKFNNKSFDYDKMVNHINRGLSSSVGVSDAILTHTLKHVKYSEIPLDARAESDVAFYMYQGTPVILIGLDIYKQAIANKTIELKAWIFNKHSLSAFENEPNAFLGDKKVYENPNIFNPLFTGDRFFKR